MGGDIPGVATLCTPKEVYLRSLLAERIVTNIPIHTSKQHNMIDIIYAPLGIGSDMNAVRVAHVGLKITPTVYTMIFHSTSHTILDENKKSTLQFLYYTRLV